MTALARILVVEKDDSIRMLLQAFLESESFEVDAAVSVDEALVLLDQGMDSLSSMISLSDRAAARLMLLGCNEAQAVQRIRAVSDIPVIVLADEMVDGCESDRILMLEQGADDYLCKPFNPRELVARSRAIIRRMAVAALPGSGHSMRYLHFNGYQLDTVARHVINPAGEVIDLSGSDYQLLLMLVQSCGEVVTRESIAEITRGRGNLPMDRFIDVQMSRLRSRLGASARRDSLIKTVRGKGYVLAASVQYSQQSHSGERLRLYS